MSVAQLIGKVTQDKLLENNPSRNSANEEINIVSQSFRSEDITPMKVHR
jgi:hypothetical protein